MKKFAFSPLLRALPLLTLPLAWTSAARAQDAAKPRTIYLYNASLGRAPASINAAKSAPWGNGLISNSRRVDYEGAPVLQLTTRNLQEGARFDFATPVNLDAYQESGFLRLRLRFRDAGGGAGGFPGGFPGGGFPGAGGFPRGGGGFPGGGGRRGGGRIESAPLLRPKWTGNAQFNGGRPPFGGALPPFGGGEGGPGGFRGGEPGEGGMGDGTGLPLVAQQTTNIKEIAVTLLRENGATAGRILVDLKAQEADEDGWRLFVLPIKGMTSTLGASGRVTRAIFTSDVEDTFYMAQAALVIESGEMTVSIRRPDDAAGAGPAEIEVKPGPVSLIADVEAGAADPIVEWNFDADNVGNLPPGALNVPAIPLGGEGGEGGMMQDGTPGGFGGRPGAMGGFPGGTGGPRGGGPRGGGPGAFGGGTAGGTAGGARGGFPGRGAGAGARGGFPGGNAGGVPGGLPGGVPGQEGVLDTGPRLDARGLTATFEYPNEEQNYRVEVTVRDRSGVKAPVTSSILVKVRG